MEEIYRNRALNYGYLTSLTLLAVIFIINIISGDFDKFGGDTKLSDIALKFILTLVVIVSYITLSTPSFRMIGENKIIKRTPPRGEQGLRGNRGTVGEDAACNECGDDLCFKKMMFNITKTINFWKQQNGMKLLDENYIIENEFIKDKVRKHCKSAQFKKLITKYGSNNKNLRDSSQEIKDIQNSTYNNEDIEFGGYDYMFKMWSIWILIILRYYNGMFFLDSYGLKEADFDGLIEREDGFPDDTLVKKTDDSTTIYRIVDKKEFPFYKIENTTTTIRSEEYINNLIPVNSNGWDDMFDDFLDSSSESTTTQALSTDTGDTKKKIIKTKKITKNADGVYSFYGINEDFIKIEGDVPSGGKLNPFHEIKKYTSWYWGSEPAGKPKFTPVIQEEDPFCNSCLNSSLCTGGSGSIGIKIKYSNSYSTIVDLSEFGSQTSGGFIKPFKSFDVNDLNFSDVIDSADRGRFKNLFSQSTLFRPQTLVDESETHPLFRNYKPVGDVLIKNTNFTKGTDASKCRPSDMSYEGEIFTPIIGRGSKANNPSGNSPANYTGSNHIYTLLVSGDTKPPKDYEMVVNYNKSTGINKNTEGLTVWKPIPECGYAALGFVFDTRAFTGTNPPKPPRNLIATVPINSVNGTTDELQISEQSDTFITNINTICHTIPLLPDDVSNSCNQGSGSSFLCNENLSINTGGIKPGQAPSNAQFKNKKYSIQKIFDNNNE